MNGITYRVINGIRYRCLDTGCPDFNAARESRIRQAMGHSGEYWAWYEGQLQRVPFGKSVPSRMPEEKEENEKDKR